MSGGQRATLAGRSAHVGSPAGGKELREAPHVPGEISTKLAIPSGGSKQPLFAGGRVSRIVRTQNTSRFCPAEAASLGVRGGQAPQAHQWETDCFSRWTGHTCEKNFKQIQHVFQLLEHKEL